MLVQIIGRCLLSFWLYFFGKPIMQLSHFPFFFIEFLLEGLIGLSSIGQGDVLVLEVLLQ